MSARGRTGRRGALAGGAGAVAAAAAWRAVHARDLRAIERDPRRAGLELPEPRLERKVASADGTRLHVAEFGPPDGPAVVLLHGWTCSLRYWAAQVRELRGRHRVVAYDMRGHGRSEEPRAGDLSIDALSDDLQAVLEASLGPGERALVAGHSLGAMTIAAWAARHPLEVPARAAAVALVNTGLSELALHSRVVPCPPALGRLNAAITTATMAAALPLPPASPLTLRAVRRLALSRHATPAQVAFCQEQILRCRPRVRAGCARTMARLDLLDGLDHLVVPTLVVAAREDRLTPPSHAERIARALPDPVELVVLERSGHMSPVEQPEAVAAQLAHLAQRTLGGRGREPVAA